MTFYSKLERLDNSVIRLIFLARGQQDIHELSMKYDTDSGNFERQYRDIILKQFLIEANV